MSDLISRQAAIDVLNSFDVLDGHTDKEEIKEWIERLPPAQSEIIYCKDCKNWDTTWTNDFSPNYHYCPMVDGVRKEDWFCADAERKEGNEMSEDMVKIDYEQLCKEYECKIKEQQKKIEGMSEEIKFKANYIARLEGYIQGLEFAIRCNGVSGAEVKF